MTPAEVRRYVRDQLMLRLGPQGFVFKGDFLLRRRLPVATDWLAVVATGRRDGGPIDVTVNVGIQCPPLHRLLGELASRPYSEIEATFSTNIAYLRTPWRSYLQWPFDRNGLDVSKMANLSEEVLTIALPFQKQFVDLASVREGCSRYGIRAYEGLRLPALDYLAGDMERASQLLRRELDAIRARSDEAAENFRSHAAKLLERMA